MAEAPLASARCCLCGRSSSQEQRLRIGGRSQCIVKGFLRRMLARVKSSMIWICKQRRRLTLQSVLLGVSKSTLLMFWGGGREVSRSTRDVIRPQRYKNLFIFTAIQLAHILPSASH